MIGSNRKGFTLVELAVSMIVIGVLLGLGMSMVGPLMTSIKIRESRENLGASVESINSYASGNNRLPDTTLLASVVRSPQDAWGRNFIYLYDANLYAASPTKDTVCGRRSTNITLTTTDPAATIPNVAYIMLSQGDDAATNTTIGGTAVTTGVQTATVTVAANTADDLVRWVTLDELRTKISCQGSQLKIVNNELPFGNVGAIYPSSSQPVTFTPDGGVKFPTTPSNTGIYEWCWTSTTSATLSDLTFNCVAPSTNTTLAKTASPTTCSATTGTWQRCTSLTLSSSAALSGTNPPSGSYDFSLSLRDNDGNIVSKTFVLTINPN